MEQLFFFVKEQFFIDHCHFQKMLDPNDTVKQSHRTYVCVKVEIDSNTFYLPLRRNLKDPIRLFGRIGHAVPSSKRPDAGLDYRYALIINDTNYLETCSEYKLPNSQTKRIIKEYDEIRSEFQTYLKGYKKAFKKNRVQYEALYRQSCLINFNSELGLV